MNRCEMKGLLSFLLLWLIAKEARTGAQLAVELQKRRGVAPSPGTIYPALKDLLQKKLVAVNMTKQYSLTRRGEQELCRSIATFSSTFFDILDMRDFCRIRQKKMTVIK
jgi:PadR family transcriptional regulator PadR